MIKQVLNKLLISFGLIIFLALLYCSYLNLTVEVHFLELNVLLLAICFYAINNIKNIYFLAYLLFLLIAQIIYILFVTGLNDAVGFSIFGGYVYLLAYISIIIYLFKNLLEKKLKKSSFLFMAIFFILSLYLLYNADRMIIKNEILNDEAYKGYVIIIYIYIAAVLMMTSLAFINLSIVFKNKFLFLCLASGSTLLSEYLQIYQIVYYGADTVGWINALDKFLITFSIILFYQSVRNESLIEERV